jgi:hypothetical protein
METVRPDGTERAAIHHGHLMLVEGKHLEQGRG